MAQRVNGFVGFSMRDIRLKVENSRDGQLMQEEDFEAIILQRVVAVVSAI
jgi:hypothetical protein